MVAAAVVGSAIVGGVMSSQAQADAADSAAAAQTNASKNAIAQQKYQFDQMSKLLSPYSQAATGTPAAFNAAKYLADNPDVAADPKWSLDPEGHWLQIGKKEGRADPGMTEAIPGSLTMQRDMLGLNGNDAQSAALKSLTNSSQFAALSQQGENAILQNASATGGLRGGNTQSALAQFRPALLAQMINDQYSRLGGMTSLGENAAAQQGNQGMQSATNIANLLQQQGASQAGLALAQGQSQANMWNTLGGAVGTFAGMGGFGSTAAAPSSTVAGYGGSGLGNGISGSMF